MVSYGRRMYQSEIPFLYSVALYDNILESVVAMYYLFFSFVCIGMGWMYEDVDN